LDVVNAYMPTVNRPLTVVLISQTSPALLGSHTWQLEVKGPTSVPVQTLGPMQHWPDFAQADNIATFAYRLNVPGHHLSNVSIQYYQWRRLIGKWRTQMIRVVCCL
jgi:hypothetical protein